MQPVDYLGHGGIALYCSHACRSRASDLRLRARQQVDLIERTLEDTRYKKGVPREELAARVRKLRAWLVRLEPSGDERLEQLRSEDDDRDRGGRKQ